MKSNKANLFTASWRVLEEDVKCAIENLKELNLEPVLQASLFDRYLGYAGTPKNRAQEINLCFENTQNSIIFGIMGGMGAIHTLEYLDYSLIKKSKKTIIGYSDITILLLSIYKFSKHVRCIHGPNIGQNILSETRSRRISLKYLKKVINKENFKIKVHKKNILVEKDEVKAPIYGGNLSLMVRTLGTPYEINTSGKILFIEQNIYTSQMIFDHLWQLKLAGKFNNIKGIISGNYRKAGRDLNEYLVEFFKDFDVPVILNQRIGHIHPNISIPLGEMCVLNTQKGFWEIRFDENKNTTAKKIIKKNKK